MGNQWPENIKKEESNSVAIYVLPCASLMLMVDLHSFCLSFAVPSSSILNHYNGWPTKDQTCPVSCDLFSFSCNRHVRCLRISLSRPSRFVLHVIINLLSLFFFYFLAKTDDGCVAHCLSVRLCSSSVCGSVCFCLMGGVIRVNFSCPTCFFLECCASNLFLLCECLSIIPRGGVHDM
jgi:hypothetical protein